MNDELLNIISNFKQSGFIFADGKRNTIKVFQYQGITISVKSFKIPILINGIIYHYFRKSKARRSFENASILLSKGIGTPKPIAFYENFSGLFLRDSYYICEHLEADFIFRDIYEGKPGVDIDKILRGIARFSYFLHCNGIEFLDHSPGNTLIKEAANGEYEFYLVDLNRMNFHESMSFELRMKNLSRLTPSKEMVAIISNEYAKISGESESLIFQTLWKMTEAFQYRYHQKKRIKKNLLFWK
jgi:hypothetical protein